ncbi:MAG: P-loop NTPase, partial [Bdellovibrionaceae bacterium]|nr:P-loop NTPase [Pseudobdellovibrionaceae bacterium]
MEGNSYPFPNHRASLPSPSGRADKKFWAVASGKGGVGKTFVATSMAITLAKTGH